MQSGVVFLHVAGSEMWPLLLVCYCGGHLSRLGGSDVRDRWSRLQSVIPGAPHVQHQRGADK